MVGFRSLVLFHSLINTLYYLYNRMFVVHNVNPGKYDKYIRQSWHKLYLSFIVFSFCLYSLLRFEFLYRLCWDIVNSKPFWWMYNPEKKIRRHDIYEACFHLLKDAVDTSADEIQVYEGFCSAEGSSLAFIWFKTTIF